MRAFAYLVVLLIVLGVGYACWQYLTVSGNARRIARAKWRVAPKTIEPGHRQIWIRCAGEDPLLIWDEKEARASYQGGDWPATAKFDEALYDADAQARDLNRLRKSDMKALT